MVDQLQGTWKSISCENYENYMKELGIRKASRKLGCLAKPIVTISADGDVITIKTRSIFKNSEISFRLGEEFEETAPVGNKTKSTVTLDNDTLVQVQDWGDKEMTIRRKLVDGQMVVESSVNSVICTRVYERI
ncbi:fatty acid-binding protein 12 isoform X2 [Perognathus longimembris pacificus]|uniref:fatty acid-binding protein 12 isoform X2 n=1 Tax=Perognathus longimembris pacificus TaxID=214514 RepID=UPI002018886D|nr:fatty acid-binding protein 12 isoform X2 [Perognathus longimembris pacificus]